MRAEPVADWAMWINGAVALGTFSLALAAFWQVRPTAPKESGVYLAVERMAAYTDDEQEIAPGRSGRSGWLDLRHLEHLKVEILALFQGVLNVLHVAPFGALQDLQENREEQLHHAMWSGVEPDRKRGPVS